MSDSESPQKNGDVRKNSRSRDGSHASRSRSRSRGHRSRSRSYSRKRSRSHSRRRSYSRGRSRDSRSRSRSYDRRRRHSPRRNRYSKSPSYTRKSSGARRYVASREEPRPNRCIGVFGLSLYTTEREVYKIFDKYGPIDKVQVVLDAQTGRSRGFAFVYYETVDDATDAKNHCSGMEIDGRRIRVDYSITERAHTPTPGQYMGRPSYGSRYGGSSYGRTTRRSPSPYSSRRHRSRSRSYSPRRRY